MEQEEAIVQRLCHLLQEWSHLNLAGNDQPARTIRSFLRTHVNFSIEIMRVRGPSQLQQEHKHPCHMSKATWGLDCRQKVRYQRKEVVSIEARLTFLLFQERVLVSQGLPKLNLRHLPHQLVLHQNVSPHRTSFCTSPVLYPALLRRFLSSDQSVQNFFKY